jgi:hypothetical protein
MRILDPITGEPTRTFELDILGRIPELRRWKPPTQYIAPQPIAPEPKPQFQSELFLLEMSSFIKFQEQFPALPADQQATG